MPLVYAVCLILACANIGAVAWALRTRSQYLNYSAGQGFRHQILERCMQVLKDSSAPHAAQNMAANILISSLRGDRPPLPLRAQGQSVQATEDTLARLEAPGCVAPLLEGLCMLSVVSALETPRVGTQMRRMMKKYPGLSAQQLLSSMGLLVIPCADLMEPVLTFDDVSAE